MRNLLWPGDEADTKIHWSTLPEETRERFASDLGLSESDDVETRLQDLRTGGHRPKILRGRSGALRVECAFCQGQFGPGRRRFSLRRLDYRKVCPSLKDDKGPSEVPYTFASFMRFVLLPYAFWLFIFGYLVFGYFSYLIATQTDSTSGTRVAAVVAIAGIAFSFWWSWRRRGERQAKRRGYWAYDERQIAWTAALGDDLSQNGDGPPHSHITASPPHPPATISNP